MRSFLAEFERNLPKSWCRSDSGAGIEVSQEVELCGKAPWRLLGSRPRRPSAQRVVDERLRRRHARGRSTGGHSRPEQRRTQYPSIILSEDAKRRSRGAAVIGKVIYSAQRAMLQNKFWIRKDRRSPKVATSVGTGRVAGNENGPRRPAQAVFVALTYRLFQALSETTRTCIFRTARASAPGSNERP